MSEASVHQAVHDPVNAAVEGHEPGEESVEHVGDVHLLPQASSHGAGRDEEHEAREDDEQGA